MTLAAVSHGGFYLKDAKSNNSKSHAEKLAIFDSMERNVANDPLFRKLRCGNNCHGDVADALQHSTFL